MKVELQAQDTWGNIMSEVAALPDLAEKEAKSAFGKIGKVLKANVQKELNRTDIAHKHMIDDVKVHTKVSDGLYSVIVSGGKDTAYKWHLVNDGTRDSEGRVKTRPTHFVDKAMNNSAEEIEGIIDSLTREVSQRGN